MSAEERAPLTISVLAKSLNPGDWVEGEGIIREVDHGKNMVIATFKDSYRGFNPEGAVVIRLEDYGETDE